MTDYTESQLFASKYFGIDPSDVHSYHSGSCFSTIWVYTKEAADKVTNKVKGQIVNGGWFHGMPLGGQEAEIVDKQNLFRVMC